MPVLMCISMEANHTADYPPTKRDCILDSSETSDSQQKDRIQTMHIMMVWFISFLKMVDAISPERVSLVVATDAAGLIKRVAEKWVMRSQLMVDN
jgi:hypothetical protein